MHINGTQIKQLQQILLGAFPTIEELGRMVRFGLEQSLFTIAIGETLTQTVFQLISWAESHDQLERLVGG